MLIFIFHRRVSHLLQYIFLIIDLDVMCSLIDSFIKLKPASSFDK